MFLCLKQQYLSLCGQNTYSFNLEWFCQFKIIECVKCSYGNIVNLFFSMPPLPQVNIWTGNICWTLFEIWKMTETKSQLNRIKTHFTNLRTKICWAILVDCWMYTNTQDMYHNNEKSWIFKPIQPTFNNQSMRARGEKINQRRTFFLLDDEKKVKMWRIKLKHNYTWPPLPSLCGFPFWT